MSIKEDLNIQKMMKNHFLARAIGDVVWRQLIEFATYKAENAGKVCKTVNPRNTSTDCCNCGNRQKMTLDDRVYDCLKCGISIDRDLNAAINIKTLGLESLGLKALEASELFREE